MMKTFMAIIPARGGSKGIKNKNLILIAGKPLVEYSIECAKKSKYVNSIYLSSDSDQILNIGIKHKVNIIKRPSSLATDEASTEDVDNR